MQIEQLLDLFGFAFIIIGVIVAMDIINIINTITWSPVISVKDSAGNQKLKRGKAEDENWERLSKRNEEAYDVSELGILVILRRQEGGNVE